MTISQKILSSQDVDTYDVDKRKAGARCQGPAEIFRDHTLTKCKPICPALVTRTVWKKGPPKINFLKDGKPFWVWSAILILVLTVIIAFAPDMLFTTEYNVQISKFSPVMKYTIFDLSKYYALTLVIFMIALAIVGYFVEINTVAGRTPQEISYMAKEYAFSCLGVLFLLLWLLLWRVFVEVNYTSEAVPVTWWSIGVIIMQFFVCFFWLDTAMFWTHYVSHIKYPINIYAMSHHFHHLFREPSALATTAIEPIEFLLSVVFVRCIQFVFPIESWILDLLIWLLYVIFSFVGHISPESIGNKWMGWDSVGLGFIKNVLNDTEKHRDHHLYVRCNYSVVLFSYWDTFLGTAKTFTRKRNS